MIRVLLVDDKSAVTAGLKAMIPWAESGAELCATAADGQQALELARRHRPQLVITDVRMPMVDGLELCRALQKELPETTLVILSAYDDFFYAQTAMRFGVRHYILKPIDRSKLKQIVAILDDVRQRNDRVAPAAETDPPSQRNASALRVRRFLEENYDDPDFTVSRTADHFGLTANYISVLYSQYFGESLHEHLFRLRLAKAKELLDSPSVAIGDVARFSGFSSATYFARAFRKAEGRSPTDYRNRTVAGTGR